LNERKKRSKKEGTNVHVNAKAREEKHFTLPFLLFSSRPPPSERENGGNKKNRIGGKEKLPSLLLRKAKAP